jgi:hypothetical protein
MKIKQAKVLMTRLRRDMTPIT